MYINPHNGLCDEAQYWPSPNFDERPSGSVIECVILHSISLPPGEYHCTNDFAQHPVAQLFRNELVIAEHPFYAVLEGVEVSAHFFITRSAQLIQFVPISQRAWHAGASYGLQSIGLNSHSVGIELEGFDEGLDGFTPAQYAQLRELLKALQVAAPAIKSNIFAHSDIAPGRKNDPGPLFDWQQISTALSGRELD